MARKKQKGGVVYVGHLPHGFYEDQLMRYFSQFGTVERVRVARNKKTGQCKGFAFLRFECDEVARIASQTMNNYLMFNKLLKCQYVEHTHPGMLGRRNCHRKALSGVIRRLKAQKKHNKGQTNGEYQKRIERILLRERKKRRKLESLGINYEFPGYKSLIEASGRKPSHILFE